MIRVRDDDVLMDSSQWSDAFGRFKQVHEWIQDTEGQIIHVPAILVHPIQLYPNCIDYIAKETKAGLMEPEIHGLEHIDYANLPVSAIVKHLQECVKFIQNEFNWNPTKWYTPWGAGSDERGAHLNDAARIVGVLRIGTREHEIRKLKGSGAAITKARNNDFKALAKKEIFMHWWEGGARLARICKTVKHGSWEEAAKHNRKLFQ